MDEKFLTIRSCAKAGILPENALRKLVAQGKCPGVKSGSRFLVNVPLLLQMLDAASREPQKMEI